MTAKRQPKVQRQIDLLAALLRHARTGVTLRDLIPQVPGYAAGNRNETSVAMMFERDKNDLRASGFPIEVVGNDHGVARYKLLPGSVYMPYLVLGDDEVARVDGLGVRGLSVQQFSRGEIALMLQGVRRLVQLGYEALAESARAGLTRLDHDLPLEELEVVPEFVRPEPGIDPNQIESLEDAIARRKRCTFTYDGLRSSRRTREVHPYLLTHREGRWYLIAHDEDARSIREFRLRRLSNLSINQKSPQSPDFEIADEFDPHRHIRPVPIWQMGSTSEEELTVRFLEDNGITAPARRLGVSHPTDPQLTRFVVRQREPFLHWVLGLGGVASVTAPADAATAFHDLLRALAVRYATGDVQ